jgi:hypothetical protein
MITSINKELEIVSSEETIILQTKDNMYYLTYLKASTIRNKLSNWMNHYRRLHPEVMG